MANKILMGPKETAGAKIMAMVTEGNITLKAGALRLGLGSRQAVRIKAAYQAGGKARPESGSTVRLLFTAATKNFPSRR